MIPFILYPAMIAFIPFMKLDELKTFKHTNSEIIHHQDLHIIEILKIAL